MNRRELLVATVLAATYASARPVFAQKATAPAAASIASIINKAGRLRMLSQRCAKAYGQLGLGLIPERAFKIMNESVASFDAILNEVTAFAPTPESKAAYLALNRDWKTYRDLLNTAPTPETGAQVQERSDGVLKLAESGVAALENFAGSSSGRLVNVCGRQRMLSQRAAKCFMFREWGVPNATDAEMLAARNEFKAAMTELRGDRQTTDEIKTQLSLVETQWLFFEKALDGSLKTKADSLQRQNIANSSERILESYEVISGMYERLGSGAARG